MIALGFYYAMFGLSLLLVVIYAFIFHKRFDVNITLMCALVPVANLGFLVMGKAVDVHEAIIGLRMSYAGCFIMPIAMFLIFNICDIPLKRWMRVLIITFSTVVYASTLTIGYNNFFYKGLPTLVTEDGFSVLVDRHYGPMHTVFYVMVVLYYLLTAGAIVYSFIRKRQVPRSILILIVLAVTIAVFGFFGVNPQ